MATNIMTCKFVMTVIMCSGSGVYAGINMTIQKEGPEAHSETKIQAIQSCWFTTMLTYTCAQFNIRILNCHVTVMQPVVMSDQLKYTDTCTYAIGVYCNVIYAHLKIVYTYVHAQLTGKAQESCLGNHCLLAK